MRAKTVPLSPRQRLTRGLSHTAAGPVDITRGVVGLGVQSLSTGTAQLRRRYRHSRLAREVSAAPALVAGELSAARDVVAALPDTLVAALPDTLRSRRPRGRRTWLIAGTATILLAGGGVAIVLLRRSAQSEEPPVAAANVRAVP